MTPTSRSTLTGGCRELLAPDQDRCRAHRPLGSHRGRYRALRTLTLALAPALALTAAAGAEGVTLEGLMQEIRGLRQQVEEQQREIEKLKREHESPPQASAAVPPVEVPAAVLVAPESSPGTSHLSQAEPPRMAAAGAAVASQPPRATAAAPTAGGHRRTGC